MSAAETCHRRGGRLLDRLPEAARRPADMVESTRWLFALLAVVSLVISLPPALTSPSATMRTLALVAAAALTASWCIGYARRDAPLSLDVLDSVAVLVIALACPQPAAAFGFLFATLWFRSLYGSGRRALLRCGMYGAAMAACLPLWLVVPGHAEAVPPATVLGVIPLMFVTVIAGRHLTQSMRAREQSGRRDAVHAALSSMLLGVTDATEVRRLANVALADICAVIPGMRVLRVTPDGRTLQVDRVLGEFATRPVELPAGVGVADPDGGDIGAVSGSSELDVLAGDRSSWVSLRLPVVRGELAVSWLLLGAPRAGLDEALLAVRSLVNQVTLALRTSDAHEELTVQARLDSLTGLANRSSFNAAVATALDDVARAGGRPTVLFLDLDDFKDVNDVLGHGSGDQVLREVAARLRRVTRPGDLCARLGGDEFAVLLGAASSAAAADVAQRIVHAVAEPTHVSGGVAQVGASVGVATADGGLNLEQLLHCADVAMYAAKAKGKGRIQVFVDGLLQVDSRQVSFERALAGAVRNDQLVVHYQPVLSLPDGRCIAAEALVRWQHPERGLLYPSAFLQLAERIGAIRDIGAYVLRRACADAVHWPVDETGRAPAVHVNVSALQLDDPTFIDSVTQCLRDVHLPAERLVLEVTETVVLADPVAIECLNALAARGVVIAIDDFGTGYSALTTLRTLPVGIVKIDKSFIAGCIENRSDRVVIEAVVKMAHQMGMRTIAEGVERPDQRDLLQSISIGAAQGFLFQRPVESAALEVWLGAHALRPRAVAWTDVAAAPR